ncbi:hypothetical protein Ade02nite_63920 [Paractinoplanes deccanensis]|uniref:Uncharacterized protein n=1 Tax=Paractinoplanes deccanensis TaxID=113561 RepID=A0ABQ3YCL1_9ACTN|nr:hypothetical protein [Actinoplanes deccanensis]GID77751.1 hypothetical protein Ade02nite_63920 [Actinoplanes deccanensis]
MKVRNVALWCAVAGLAALSGIAPAAAEKATAGVAPAAGEKAPARNADSTAAEGKAAKRTTLPACPPLKRSTRPPTRPAGSGAPGACRAATSPVVESGVRLPRRGEAGFTPSGYHHLGANTGGEWAGVSGRMSIVDGSIRPRSYDFVAGRFMVKRNLGRGVITWLEAGWAETGWAGPGRQHIYTFNTNTKTWQFYDQYALRPGDKVWLDLHSDPGGVWSAWLWWGNRWNLLTAQRLAIGETAVVEQYVEVHVDAGRPGLIDVPPVTVDNVRLRPADGGEPRLWREDVPTLTGTDPTQRQQRGGFCLDWQTRYDTWTAGDCDRGLLRSAAPPRPPLPLGDADVVGDLPSEKPEEPERKPRLLGKLLD